MKAIGAPLIPGRISLKANLRIASKSMLPFPAHRPDAVMHFAANALVGESMQNPSKYFRNNICNGLNLLDAMVAAGVQRIVFSSTCAIFGPPDRVPIDETALAASHQSIRRIQTRIRENFALVRRDSRREICLPALFQCLLAHRRNLAKTIGRRRISFPLCYRWRSVKDRTSKSMEPTTTRRTEHVFATTFTSSIWPTRTFWLSAEAAADVTTSARAAAPVFEK